MAHRLSSRHASQIPHAGWKGSGNHAAVSPVPERRPHPIVPRLGRPSPQIVAIGGSAGGIEAVSRLLATLPGKLPAALVIVIHRSGADHLADVLARHTELKVMPAHEGDRLGQGVCLVAPPGPVLWIGPDLQVHLLHDGFYRSHRIDATFSSLAVNAGCRTVGVILSGTLGDGAMGLRALKEAGGTTLVQSSLDAEFTDMPQNAVEQAGNIDFQGSAEELGQAICQITGVKARS